MDFRESIIIERLHELGPRLTEEEIRVFENEIGAKLPQDYREFLLEYNGGCNYEEQFIKFPLSTKPDGIWLDSPVGDAIGLISLMGLNSKPNWAAEDMRSMLLLYKDRFPSGMIPIGDDGGDLLILDPRDGGKVYLWVHEMEHRVEHLNDNKCFLADSFTAFLLGCRYVSEEEKELDALESEEPFRSIELHRNEELRRYLDEGLLLFETNSQEQTPLYVACRDLNYEAAEELLRRGADPDDGDRGRGYPPIYAAAAPGASEQVALLLSYGASPYMDADRTRHVLDSLPTPPTQHMRNVFANTRTKHRS